MKKSRELFAHKSRFCERDSRRVAIRIKQNKRSRLRNSVKAMCREIVEIWYGEYHFAYRIDLNIFANTTKDTEIKDNVLDFYVKLFLCQAIIVNSFFLMDNNPPPSSNRAIDHLP